MTHDGRPRKYLNIKEASAQYDVSRAKIHRMIKSGRLGAVKDPRDERSALLSVQELDDLFHHPVKEGNDMDYRTHTEDHERGGATAARRARIDAVRRRIGAGRVFEDSVAIVREQRLGRGGPAD